MAYALQLRISECGGRCETSVARGVGASLAVVRNVGQVRNKDRARVEYLPERRVQEVKSVVECR